MFDYSFFALLFLLAEALAPEGKSSLVLENTRHVEQRMEWSRAADGRWAMTVNGRGLGHFERTATEVVHHTGQGDPTRFSIAELAVLTDLRPSTTRVRLRGRFTGAIAVASEGGATILTDPSRELLRTPLRLTAR